LTEQRSKIAEIAAAAGVSIPTVSKVLHQRPDVAAKTRERIERIIAESGYVHNRGIHSQIEGQGSKTQLIDLISPNALDSEYGLEILRGIEEVLSQTENRLALYSMHNDTPRERQWLSKLSNKTTDGALLFTPLDRTRHLEKLREQHIPCVVIDDVLQLEPDIPCVGATNWIGGLTAVEYLLGLGHRRIAIITGIATHLTSRARLAGYRAALETQGIAVDPSLIRPGDFEHESGYRETLALLALPEPPTALFVASDAQAIGVYRALYTKNLHVPNDMSVIGFDDIPSAARMSPPLTTIRQPLREMGRMATQMLLQMIAGETLENKRVELATSLIVRESCMALEKSGL
jgi:LacI family transcriptional regulator